MSGCRAHGGRLADCAGAVEGEADSGKSATCVVQHLTSVFYGVRPQSCVSLRNGGSLEDHVGMRPCLARRRLFSLSGRAGAAPEGRSDCGIERTTGILHVTWSSCRRQVTTLSPNLKRGLFSARNLVKGDCSEEEKVVDVISSMAASFCSAFGTPRFSCISTRGQRNQLQGERGTKSTSKSGTM